MLYRSDNHQAVGKNNHQLKEKNHQLYRKQPPAYQKRTTSLRIPKQPPA